MNRYWCLIGALVLLLGCVISVLVFLFRLVRWQVQPNIAPPLSYAFSNDPAFLYLGVSILVCGIGGLVLGVRFIIKQAQRSHEHTTA